MIINVYFFETVHLFIECFFRKMFIQFVNIIIEFKQDKRSNELNGQQHII